MVSSDLSQYLEANSIQQTNCECDSESPFPKRACQDRQDYVATRKKRLSALKVSRVKANRGVGDENVSCLSFRQASSLGIVVVLLSNTLIDITVLCAVLGAAVSTVFMALELRLETLDRRKERESMRQSMLETSLELRLAMLGLEQAEAEADLFSTAQLSRFQLDLDEQPD